MTTYLIFLGILIFSIILTSVQMKFAQRKELYELDQLFEDIASE